MKSKRKAAPMAGVKRLAPLCLYAARTALSYLDALTAAMEGVRRAQDSECVHHMRVASRRLWSILPLLAGCLARQRCDRWRKQLRRRTGNRPLPPRQQSTGPRAMRIRTKQTGMPRMPALVKKLSRD